MLWAVLLCLAPAPADAAGRGLKVIDSSIDPLTLDPHRSFDPNSEVVMSQIYEGLIDYDIEGRLVPRLAARWERLSPTRLRFWLRKGVRFHNGEPFDARCVVFSIDRQLRGDPKAMNAWLFDPDFHAEAVSPHIVDLVTKRPDARLPYTLAMFVKILPPSHLKANGEGVLDSQPVGTGPYRFNCWIRGRHIKLDANPDYWKPGLPRIKELTFLFLPQAEHVPALLQGRADLVSKLPGKDTLRVMAGPNTRVLKKHVSCVFWAAMKNFNSPFADRRVRQAMNYAVNKRHLIQYVDKGNSMQVPTMTNPIDRDFNPDLRPYRFDPHKARRLLKEAGYPNGFTARVLASEDTGEMIRTIQSQLRMVGVKLDLDVVPREEYLRQTILPKIRTGKPKFTGDMVVWLTPNPTLDAFFSPAVIFYSGSPYSIMSDPVFDGLYHSFIRQSDEASRREHLFRLQAYMFEQAFGIYTAQRVRTVGLHWDLNLELHPSGMLVGFTLAEACWEKRAKSLWNGAEEAHSGRRGAAERKALE